MFEKNLFFVAVLVGVVIAGNDNAGLESRIVGGVEAGKKEARFVAQIFEVVPSPGTRGTVKFVGTGAFLSGRTVLTSASIIEK